MGKPKGWGLIFLSVLIWGMICYLLYAFLWSPDNNDQPEEVVGNESSDSPTKSDLNDSLPPQFSQADKLEAKNVVEKFLHIYISTKRNSPNDLANMLAPYASYRYIDEINRSQKIDPAIPIKEMTSSLVTPPSIPNGLTYHVIVLTKDNVETDYWFSLVKVNGKWIIAREELY